MGGLPSSKDTAEVNRGRDRLVGRGWEVRRQGGETVIGQGKLMN